MEAIALIADIHANLLAAEAVLSDIHKKHRPDRIISLGDQVNLGPAPRDTLRLLRSENVTLSLIHIFIADGCLINYYRNH